MSITWLESVQGTGTISFDDIGNPISDRILDTVILLDDFEWACEGGTPVTMPGRAPLARGGIGARPTSSRPVRTQHPSSGRRRTGAV